MAANTKSAYVRNFSAEHDCLNKAKEIAALKQDIKNKESAARIHQRRQTDRAINASIDNGRHDERRNMSIERLQQQHNAEVAELEQQLAASKRQIAELQSNHKGSQDKRDNMMPILEQLRQQHDAEVADLEAQIDQSKQQVTDIQAKAKTAQDQIDSLEASLAQEQAARESERSAWATNYAFQGNNFDKISSLISRECNRMSVIPPAFKDNDLEDGVPRQVLEVTYLLKLVKISRKSCNLAHEDRQSVEKEKFDLQHRLEELNSQEDKEAKEKDDLKQQLEESKSDGQTKSTEIEKLKERLQKAEEAAKINSGEYEKKLKEVEDATAAKSEECDKLKVELKEAQDSRDRLSNDLQKESNDYDSLKRQHEQLQSQLDSQTTELENLKSTNETLVGDAQQHSQSLQAERKKSADERNRRNNAEQKLESADAEVNRLTEMIRSLRTQLLEFEAGRESEASLAPVDDGEDEQTSSEALKQTLECVRGKKSLRPDELDHLRTVLSNIKNNSEAVISQLRCEKDAAEACLQDTVRMLEKLHAFAQSIWTDRNALMQELCQCASEIDELCGVICWMWVFADKSMEFQNSFMPLVRERLLDPTRSALKRANVEMGCDGANNVDGAEAKKYVSKLMSVLLWSLQNADFASYSP